MQAPDFQNRNGNGHAEDAEWIPVGTLHPVHEQPPVYPPPRARRRWWLHIALFIATAASCYLVAGPAYAVGIMAILLTHEMGHYLTSLRWRVDVSLPYFLPFPDIPMVARSPIGTFGAVIVMKSRMPNRRSLLDIGAAGPVAGFLVSLAVLAIGLGLSRIDVLPNVWPPEGYMAYVFGDSLLFIGLRWLILGPLPPGHEVFLHPLARAGWVGLFVTALNLLPIGQLDGGHILYALHRRHYRLIVLVTTFALVALVFVSAVWTLFALLAVVFGQKHPPPLDDVTPIDPIRRAIGYFCLVILILCFMPNPLDVVGL